MRKLCPTHCLLVLSILLSGCGGSTDGGGQPGAVGDAGVVAPAAPGTLQVILNLPPPDVLARLLDEASRYTIILTDPATGASLAPESSGDFAVGTPQTVNIPNVPSGQVRVHLSAFSNDQVLVGTSEQDVTLPSGGSLQVEITTLFTPGPTREVGLLSVTSNGVPANGDSEFPTISQDGRFVAFRTRATTILNSIAPPTLPLIPPAVVTIDRANRVLTAVLDQREFRLVGQELLMGTELTWALGTGRTAVLIPTTLSSPVLPPLPPNPTLRGVFTALNNPDVTPDGAKVVLEGVKGADGAIGVVLWDVLARTVREISLGDGSTPATVAFSPAICDDGSSVVFYADNLKLGGTSLGPFVYRHETANRRNEPLFARTGPSQVDISGDGKLVAAVTAGRLVLYDISRGVLETVADQVTSRPSLSNEELVFSSQQSDLVFNDANGVEDLFSYNIKTKTVSRLNVAADGTPVAGGVKQPAQSGNGTRVAFVSSDDLLVPGDINQNDDVFSAANPTRGKLYVSTGSEILRFDGAADAHGAVQPAATITSTSLTEGGRLLLDTLNDRLYVANKTNILVFSKISTRNGAALPERVIQLGFKPVDLALDQSRDILYVASETAGPVRVYVGATTLNGTAKIARSLGTVGGKPTTLFIDPRRDELYVGTTTGGTSVVNVFRGASRLNGAALTPNRQLAGANTNLGTEVAFVDMDASPRGGAAGHAANLMVGTLGTRRLLTYQGNGLELEVPFGNVAPLRTLAGPSSQLDSSSIGQTVVDRYTGTTYVAGPDSKAVVVFNRLTTTNSDAAPDRVINVGTVQGIALDRTR